MPALSRERTVNWIPHVLDSGDGKTRIVFYPSPGKRVFCTLPTYPVRGQFQTVGRMFAVGGNVLYEIFSDGSYTVRGIMATNDNPATLSSSGATGNQLFVTSGRNGYIYDLVTNAFTNVVTDVDQGGYIIGYFVGLDWLTGTLVWSDLLDGLTFNPINAQQRIDAGDGWSGLWVGYQELWLWGTQDAQVWGTTGDADQPFAPLTGSTIQYGIYGGFTAFQNASEPTWLSRNAQGQGVVMRGENYQAVRISNSSVENAIEGYIAAGLASDVCAWGYEEGGHAFYVLNFPSAAACWVYDFATNLWHEEGEWNSAEMRYNAKRQQYHCLAFDQHLVGDRITGDIYLQSQNIYLDGATPIRRLRIPPSPRRGMVKQYFHRLQLLLGVGQGAPTPAPPPQVMYRYSDDGGNTWSEERVCGAGNLGDYGAEVHWDANGSAYNRVDEIVVSDPYPWYIDSAYLEMTDGYR